MYFMQENIKGYLQKKGIVSRLGISKYPCSPLSDKKNFCFVSKPGSKNGLHASDYSFYTSIRRHSVGIKNSYHAK